MSTNLPKIIVSPDSIVLAETNKKENDTYCKVAPDWTLTDPDAFQFVRYARERGKRVFECVQAYDLPTGLMLGHGFVYLDDYSSEDIEKILNFYDLPDIPEDRILAECFFETEFEEFISSGPYKDYVTLCKKIGEIVSVPVEQVIDWESIFRSFFDSVTTATHGKVQYFDQGNGTWYSRISGEYLSLDDALKEYIDAVRE